MVRLDRFRAACTGIDGVADAGIINASANANDHGSQLASLRMNVNQKKCFQCHRVTRLMDAKFEANFGNGLGSVSIAPM